MKLIANNYEPKDICKIMREWTDLNQEEYAESLGIKKRVVSSYETGERQPNFKTIIKMAKKHNIKIIFEKEGNSAK